MWDRDRKKRGKTTASEIPCATLADLRVEGSSRGPFSARPRPSRRLRLSPQHSTAQQARSRRYSQAGEAAAPLPALPLRALHHTECGARGNQPLPPPAAATSASRLTRRAPPPQLSLALPPPSQSPGGQGEHGHN